MERDPKYATIYGELLFQFSRPFQTTLIVAPEKLKILEGVGDELHRLLKKYGWWPELTHAVLSKGPPWYKAFFFMNQRGAELRGYYLDREQMSLCGQSNNRIYVLGSDHCDEQDWEYIRQYTHGKDHEGIVKVPWGMKEDQ